MSAAIGANRLSFTLGLRGSSATIDTACGVDPVNDKGKGSRWAPTPRFTTPVSHENNDTYGPRTPCIISRGPSCWGCFFENFEVSFVEWKGIPETVEVAKREIDHVFLGRISLCWSKHEQWPFYRHFHLEIAFVTIMGSQLSVYQVTKIPSQFQLSSSFTSIPAGSSSLMAISAAAENLRQPSRHAGRDGLRWGDGTTPGPFWDLVRNHWVFRISKLTLNGMLLGMPVLHEVAIWTRNFMQVYPWLQIVRTLLLMLQKSKTTTGWMYKTLEIVTFQLPFPQLVIEGFLNHQQYHTRTMNPKDPPADAKSENLQKPQSCEVKCNTLYSLILALCKTYTSARWLFPFFFQFSPRYLGKWSNLIFIFFRLKPPTSLKFNMIHRKIEGIWTSEIGDDFLSFQLFQVAAACELLPDVSGFFFRVIQPLANR